MAKNSRSETAKTPMCRLSYASGLFKARKVNEKSTKEVFSCTLIFEKKDKPFFEKMIVPLITEAFGSKAVSMFQAGVIHNPLYAGDSKEAKNKETGEINPGLGPDVFFIRVQAGKDRPPFVIWKDPNKPETEESVYSGCYGKAVIQAFSWDDPQGGKGISFGIEGFQKLKEGERLGGGRADPSKFYETVEDMGDAPAETKSGAGASGLFGD